MTCSLAFPSPPAFPRCFLFLFFPGFFFCLCRCWTQAAAQSQALDVNPNIKAMIKISTYQPESRYPEYAFFILNKGMNSGKPLEKPCANCFIIHTTTQDERDLYFWLCFSLWKSKSFHEFLIGSVIPYVRIQDVRQMIDHAAEEAKQNLPAFHKKIEAIKILEMHEKQFHDNLLLISEAKKAIFARYHKGYHFYR